MQGPSTERHGRIWVWVPQTLSEADRRIVAVWAADCAERVWDCLRRKLRGIPAPAMPSPGYGPLPVASLASSEGSAAVSSLMALVR